MREATKDVGVKKLGMRELYEDLLRKEELPHVWCAGCANGIVLGAFVRAFNYTGLKRDSTVVVSGIGCSGRITQYLNFDTVHTTHGRALAFATGIKLANPELTVVVFMGDGDASAIGGNHLIHAARRNIDITAIIINNSLYGMTGGQVAPTTPEGMRTKTTPYGNPEPPFDISKLVAAAGATYVARFTSYHVRWVEKAIAEALLHRGFSVVEVVTGCPTHMKRKPAELLKFQKESFKRGKPSIQEIAPYDIGIFVNEIKPEFTEKVRGLIGVKGKSGQK
jgi:2-oxoglutarate ferredoxin oxidoreductase subunit beta